jgi:hypothetical protein
MISGCRFYFDVREFQYFQAMLGMEILKISTKLIPRKYGQIRAILNGAGQGDGIINGIWAECVSTTLSISCDKRYRKEILRTVL